IQISLRGEFHARGAGRGRFARFAFGEEYALGMISVLLSTAPLLTVQSAVRHVESKLLFSPFAKLILHVAAQRPRVSGDTSEESREKQPQGGFRGTTMRRRRRA